VVLEQVVKEIMEELGYILELLILAVAVAVLVLLAQMQLVEAMVVREELENNHLLMEQQLITLAVAEDLQTTLQLD
jgi:hypothetical protein